MPGPDGSKTDHDRRQDQLFLEAQRANHFIENTVEAFKDTVDKVLGAALIASKDYDIIMKVEASKSLFGEILSGVILTLLPSLKILQVTAGPGVLNLKRGVKLIGVLEDKLDDLTKNFADPLSENKQKEESITQQQQILAASNTTLKEELGDIYELSQKVTDAAKKARRFIRMKSEEFLNGKDTNISLLPQIQKDFKEVGVDDNSKVGKEELLSLSDKILYDMLKQYVESYVVFWIVDRPRNYMNAMEGMQANADWAALRSKRIADLPQNREDWFITGIDLPKRIAIYNKFTNGVAADIKRPGVKDYKDMIRYWNAATVNSSKAKIFLQ